MLFPPVSRNTPISRKDNFQVVLIQHLNVSFNTSFTLYLYTVKNCLGIVIQRCRINYQYRSYLLSIYSYMHTYNFVFFYILLYSHNKYIYKLYVLFTIHVFFIYVLYIPYKHHRSCSCVLCIYLYSY